MYNFNSFKCNKRAKDPVNCISLTDNYLFITNQILCVISNTYLATLHKPELS